MATDFNPDQIVRQVTESLVKKFPGRDGAEIEHQVRDAVDVLKDRPIHDYVGVLAERAVKKRLKDNNS
jgi:hypothetical protein